MSGYETAGVISILVIGAIFIGLWKLLGLLSKKPNIFFDYEHDYNQAFSYNKKQNHHPNTENENEKVFLGVSHFSQKGKNVFVDCNAKHVFICGTTGSGKTVAISNFIKAGADYDYPMLIVDGKGDTDAGSLMEITKNICGKRKIYIINLNEPTESDRYNPFKNTNTDVIKDMLINMTNWSEEHYKYNTERYLLRLLRLMSMKEIKISLDSLTRYLPTINFTKLSKDLSVEGKISKEDFIEDMELAKTSGKIAEAAAARFATIKESHLGQIFCETGIDIYTALEENAIILFVLNPLLYPEMSPLIGNLIIIDSKKAVSNFYKHKKKRIFYILDEINVYASMSLLDLVNKSRSANITCVLATQSLSDLDGVNDHFKEQIIENCNNYIVLRQNSSVNAEHWSNVLGTKISMQATYQIKGGANGAESTDLGSLRKTREYIYHPDDIKLLGAGRAIFLSRDKMFHTKIKVNKPF